LAATTPTSPRQVDRVRMALCGAAIVFVRTLDAGSPDPGELGYRIERLRSMAANYLAALGATGEPD
jgi:hypothetical protein